MGFQLFLLIELNKFQGEQEEREIKRLHHPRSLSFKRCDFTGWNNSRNVRIVQEKLTRNYVLSVRTIVTGFYSVAMTNVRTQITCCTDECILHRVTILTVYVYFVYALT